MSYHHRTQAYDFTGTMDGRVGMTPNIGGGGYFLGDHSEFRLDVGGVVRFEISFGSVVAGGAGWRIPMTLDLSWLSGFIGSPPTDTDTVYVIDVAAGPAEQNLTGTYTVDFGNCWELVDVSDGVAGSPSLTDEFNHDRALRLVVRIKAGSVITATCDYGGAHVSKTATVTTDFDVPANVVTTASALGFFGGSDMVITNHIGGIGETTGGGTFSDTHHSAVWGPTCEIHADDGYVGRIIYTLSGLVQYNWFCQVRALSATYPGPDLIARVTIGQDAFGSPVTQDVTLTGGASSLFIEQKSFIVSVEFEGASVHFEDVVTLWPVSAHLTSASLTAAGEDPDLSLRNLWMRGWLWGAASLDQVASLDAISGSWSATGSGGSITVPAASFDSRLLGSSWSGADLSGFGFANVFLTGDASSLPARINLGAKYWDVVVGTTGHAVLDLCSPGSAHAAYDTQDTIYPLVGGSPYTATDGWSTGVHNAPSVVIDGLASGHTYTLTKITLVRVDHAKATFLDPFKSWNLVVSNTVGSVTSTTYYRSWLTGDTDGSPSLEETDAVWINTSGSSSGDTVSPASILAAVGSINGSGGAYPTRGWSASDLQATDGTLNLRSGLLNSDREAVLLYAGGLWYDGSAWQSGIDLAVPLSSIKAQYLFNSIVAYSGAGDVWGWSGGAFGGPVELKCGIILRGQAWGLVFDTPGGARVGSQSVTAVDSASHIARGSGTTDAYGEFHTGTPWILGATSANIAAGSLTSYTNLFGTRQMRRFGFQVPPPFSNPYNATHPAWGYLLRSAIGSGNAFVWRSNHGAPFGGWDAGPVQVTTGGQDSDPRLRYDADTGRLFCCFARSSGGSSDVYEAFSDDDGDTWGAEYLAITGGTHPTYGVGLERGVITACYVGPIWGPGVLTAIYQGPGELAPGSPYNLKDDTGTDIPVQDDTFSIVMPPNQSALWLLTVTVDGDSAPSEWYSAEPSGASWTRIP